MNTNLEKVSDWLTTLLIGATLVQIGSIPGWLGGLSTFIEPAVGVANSRVAPFVVVFYFGLAFLGVYLITRLYLTTALNLPGIDGDNGIGALSETEAEAVVEAGSGAAPAAAAAGDDAAALTALVSKAGASGDPAAIEGALAKVEAVQGSARTDPGLNGALARLLAKSIADGSPAADRRDALQAAVQRAALDPDGPGLAEGGPRRRAADDGGHRGRRRDRRAARGLAAAEGPRAGLVRLRAHLQVQAVAGPGVGARDRLVDLDAEARRVGRQHVAAFPGDAAASAAAAWKPPPVPIDLEDQEVRDRERELDRRRPGDRPGVEVRRDLRAEALGHAPRSCAPRGGRRPGRGSAAGSPTPPRRARSVANSALVVSRSPAAIGTGDCAAPRSRGRAAASGGTGSSNQSGS